MVWSIPQFFSLLKTIPLSKEQLFFLILLKLYSLDPYGGRIPYQRLGTLQSGQSPVEALVLIDLILIH